MIFGTGSILIGNLDGTSEIGANISHFPPTSKQRLTQSQIATYYHQSAFTQCIAACYYTYYTTARKENDLLRPPHSGQTQSQSFYLIKVGTRRSPSAALLYLVQTYQPIFFFRKVDLDDNLDFKSMLWLCTTSPVVCISSGLYHKRRV